MAVRERAFVEAARCGGNSELRIAFRHVLPNALAAPLTQLSVVLGFSVLLTAGLSFVGAGIQLPTPEWGLMVSEGASTMITGQWWIAVFPGIALASAVFGFALLGDGLRVYLDPVLRQQAMRIEAPAGAVSSVETGRFMSVPGLVESLPGAVSFGTLAEEPEPGVGDVELGNLIRSIEREASPAVKSHDSPAALLTVRDLRVNFHTDTGINAVLSGGSLSVDFERVKSALSARQEAVSQCWRERSWD